MLALRTFLKAHRVGRGQPSNLVSLAGGSFYVPPEHRGELFSLLAEAIPEMTSKNHLPLAFRPAQKEKQPVLVDLDFRYKDKPAHSPEDHIAMASFIGEQIGEGGESWLMVMKPKPYRCEVTVKQNGVSVKQGVWKSGCHLYYPESSVDLETARRVRASAVDHVRAVYNSDLLLNSADDVVDDCVTLRKNGLMLAGVYKKGGDSKGGRYNVVAEGYQNSGSAQVVFYDDLEWLENVTLTSLYDWVFDHAREAVQKPKTLNPAKTAVKIKGRRVFQINLPAFLSALGAPPDNDEYQSVCMFLANCDIDSRLACELCNAKWKPGNPRETQQFIERYRGLSVVGIQTVRDILHDRGAVFQDGIVFPRKMYTHYNEYRGFLRGTHSVEEFENFITDVVSYSFGDQKYVWKDYYTVRDKHGNQYREENVRVQKLPPFGLGDDVMIEFHTRKSEIRKAYNKWAARQAKLKPDKQDQNSALIEEFVTQLDVLEPAYRAQKAQDLLGVNASERLEASSVVRELHMRHAIPRYEKLEFRPFSGATDPCRSKHKLNLFTAFHLEQYEPKRKVQFEVTTIHQYLLEVMGCNDPELYQYFIKQLANLVQSPQVRSGRLMVLRSLEQGTGKSTYCRLLKAILGRRNVCFYNNLSRITSRFNSSSAFRLIIFVDDISAASKKETRNLFPLVTQDTTIVEKKGQAAFEIDEYSNIILTSNDKSPLYCNGEDRRQLILEVSSCRKRDRTFFEKLNSELHDLDVMKAVYEHLKQLDLGEFHPAHDPPSLAKQESIAGCMPITHRFVRDFFADSNWPFEFWPHKCVSPVNVQIKCEKRRIFRVVRADLYRAFSEWARTRYPRHKTANIDQFSREISEVGVEVHSKRLRVDGMKKMVDDLQFDNVEEMFKQVYPTETVEVWDAHLNLEAFKSVLNKGSPE